MNENAKEKCSECCSKALGSYVIAICITALMVCGCIWLYHCLLNEPKINKVNIEFVSSDSILDKNYLTQEQVDSIVKVINKHEAQMSDKYQYFIEQKYNEDKYFSVFTVLLGIVFSIFGFFGYKSITSIEDKAIKVAQTKSQEIADKIARQTADKVAKEYMENNVTKYVNDASNVLFHSEAAEVLKNGLKASLYSELENHLNKLVDERIKESREDSDNRENDSEVEEGHEAVTSSESLFS